MGESTNRKLKSLVTADEFIRLLEEIDDMILIKEPGSKIVWGNQSFRNFYNMSADELVGIIDSPANDADATLSYVRDDAYVVATAQKLDIPLEPVNNYKGETHWFHTTKFPILIRDGKVLLTAGISRNVTEIVNEQRKHEEERARFIYASKMATLGEMAGGVAHEINNPMSVISLLAEEIRESLVDQKVDIPQLLTDIKKIEAMASRVSKIINGLKTFSRDASRDGLMRSDLNTIIEETLALCQEKLIFAGIKIIINLPAEKIEFDCRPTQISQILLNLVGNAADAIEKLEEKWIQLDVKESSKFLELSVSNSGPRISEELAGAIFKPFFTTKEIGKGTGLGLGVSKGLAESHGGSLHLDANSKNTRFILTLPKN